MPAWGAIAITILIIVGLIALALRRATAELHQLERDPFGVRPRRGRWSG